MRDDGGRNDRGGHDFMDHRGGVDSLWVSGLSLVADLHHGAAIAAISCVGHILDPAVRESHTVLALDVALGVSMPALAEVGVVLIVMDSVGEAEGVGLIILLVTALRNGMDHGSGDNMAAVTYETNPIGQRNTGDQARETGDNEGMERNVISNK